MERRSKQHTEMLRRFTGGWWPVLLIALLTSLLLYQQWRIKHPQRPLALKVGDVLPEVSAVTLQGHSGRLAFRSPSKTILYAFSPDCVFCQRNEASFKALLRQASTYRVVAVSLKTAGLGEFVSKSDLNGSGALVYSLSGEARRQLKLTVTPETVIISQSGVVENVWPGAYVGRIGKAVEDTLRVKLPIVAAVSR